MSRSSTIYFSFKNACNIFIMGGQTQSMANKIPSLIITVPIFNEGEMTAINTQRIYDFCNQHLNPLADWKIILTENGSTDKTFEIAQKIAEKYPGKILAYH